MKRVFHASSIKPFCFAPLLFLTFRRMSCLRQKSKWSRKNSSDQRQSLVFISRRLTGDARYTKSIYVLLSRSIVWSLLCYCVRNREHCCVLCDVARNFFFSSPPSHAKFRTWKIKTTLSQTKLIKPPVVRETISITQKTFLPTGVSWPFKSNKDIAAHEFAKRFVLTLGIHLTNLTLWLTAAEICDEIHVIPKLN